MSPIYDLQRRLVERGRIRVGGERKGRGAGKRLEHFRVTTPDEPTAQAIAQCYGGEVNVWDSPSGKQFQVYTERPLQVTLVPVGQPGTQWMELWSGGGCVRRCDGDTEQISGDPCMCKNEDEPQCKPTTRLQMMIGGVPGWGTFLLTTGSWYAATEMVTLIDLADRAHASGIEVSGTLVIEQRRVVRGGTTKQFPVPVFRPDGVDLQTLIRESGYVPAQLTKPAGKRPALGGSKPELPEPRPMATDEELIDETLAKALWKEAQDAGLDKDAFLQVVKEVAGVNQMMALPISKVADVREKIGEKK